ncbi:Uncharacterized protein dnm_068820 [Desulfonema magnum]|uniref:Uncharacterized protein n=1 Tax=Desulfonema magnum TaxID=45655 RepID=A0A975BTF3_9BACT|nr:Uncharacterized protein dnm_068820 [Desulfonema magnum]
MHNSSFVFYELRSPVVPVARTLIKRFGDFPDFGFSDHQEDS